ncbi:DUF397 domain-containing protein [Kitasatospora viridis]|uniref:Uncharacterized protein DUF397 n=1 Tax=Kitasatospora viridis TaxID=281105 RepID=A0A561UIX6_9ACTN|nr:DUF397 domain-containing protein [Kitasatospora viridis]TWF99306.1 uncharacterized protein DUF397 [Kitasatospora viridis]
MMPRTQWRKSSYSGGTANDCVEVALAHPAVRDSKDPDGPALVFTPDAWSAFLTELQSTTTPLL